MKVNLELGRVLEEIRKRSAKTVLIQLPDGLKPRAEEIHESLKESGAKIYIWAGSCFGACDIPDADYDLLIQWGHSKWNF